MYVLVFNIHIFMHICIYMGGSPHSPQGGRISAIEVYIYICIYIYIYMILLYMNLFIFIYFYVYLHSCVNIFMDICVIHTYIFIYTYLYMNIYRGYSQAGGERGYHERPNQQTAR
jgi:hypothetical protein